MTTNTLHFGLTYAGVSRRVLRARRTAWKALRLLVLSALCGAAWSAGKAAEVSTAAMRTAPRVEAGTPWPVAVFVLILCACAAAAVWRQGRNDRLGEVYAGDDPYEGQWPDAGVKEEGWMVELRAFFGARGVLVTDVQAREMRVLCAPVHANGLVMLDHYLRVRLRLRLFMTSLMEVERLCNLGVEGRDA